MKKLRRDGRLLDFKPSNRDREPVDDRDQLGGGEENHLDGKNTQTSEVDAASNLQKETARFA